MAEGKKFFVHLLFLGKKKQKSYWASFLLCFTNFIIYHLLCFHRCVIIIFCLQEKGSDEIALKAMGRAINKTVMIAELIKVL